LPKLKRAGDVKRSPGYYAKSKEGEGKTPVHSASRLK
jgi:hypothetical protein